MSMTWAVIGMLVYCGVVSWGISFMGAATGKSTSEITVARRALAVGAAFFVAALAVAHFFL